MKIGDLLKKAKSVGLDADGAKKPQEKKKKKTIDESTSSALNSQSSVPPQDTVNLTDTSDPQPRVEDEK
ncbi:polycystic kidney disease 2-like 2 protein [Sesbania bispinosa]|nr:polycystic kidney disease 2-like 2 protein [Sesbania bispinosa]